MAREVKCLRHYRHKYQWHKPSYQHGVYKHVHKYQKPFYFDGGSKDRRISALENIRISNVVLKFVFDQNLSYIADREIISLLPTFGLYL